MRLHRTLFVPICGAVLLAEFTSAAQTVETTAPPSISGSTGTSSATPAPAAGTTVVTSTSSTTTTITVTLPGTSSATVLSYVPPSMGTPAPASLGGSPTGTSTASGFNGTLGSNPGLTGFSGYSTPATSPYAGGGGAGGIAITTTGSQGPAYIDVPGMTP
jgi:hypothetical protein